MPANAEGGSSADGEQTFRSACRGNCGSRCPLEVTVREGKVVKARPMDMPGEDAVRKRFCVKGFSQPQRVYDTDRLKYPMKRVGERGAGEWERISWDEAFDGIARHVKKTRDETFVQTEDGYTVNRTEGFAFLGGSQINNEECWLLQKFCRTLGSIAIDNQTRVCHSSTVAGLGPSFGRGSMTSHWCDFANADVILTAGSNNVENHPLSSRWVQRAQDKGATWIVIDPRFTRSAKNADIYGRIRPGTDIAFWGGLISYIINNKLYQEEYVLNYTNAACILTKDYDFDPKTGLFTGFDEASKSYSAESWGYDVERFEQWDTTPTGKYAWVKKPGTPNFVPPELEILKRDMTLENPLCVLNVMKRHYDRYTPEMVAKVTGMDPDVMMKIWQVYAGTGKPGKAGSNLIALFRTGSGMSQLVLSLTIGPQSLWAFSTTTEDVAIRNNLYQRLGPSETLRRLAARFPGGSAKAEVERRRRNVEDQSDADGEVVNVILEIANEIAREL